MNRNLTPKSFSFDYSLRVSSRVRNVRLAIKPYRGLEVVIPKRFPQHQIPHILQQHEAWILLQLEKHCHSLTEPTLPDNIQISFINNNIKIHYENSNQAKLIETEGLLIIRHSTRQQAIQLLRNWVRNRAKQFLPAELNRLAVEFGFDYKKTTVRSQKSRWGSCSSSGTISLNDQLLFMPEATIQYLMIHELCHTRHMNHSAAFWALVEHCRPDYKVHETRLAKAREKIPAWFSRSLFSA